MTADEQIADEQIIVDVLREHGKVPISSAGVDPDADLYALGLTSHASVNVMLALEDAFDIELPDRLLRKSTFASVGAIRSAVQEVRGAA
ncbi:acyl carrier protein [Rhodococcus sp. X156]|uniref:acyl carrier protein n=1 Tax=Rhodococcus sp. X156 TaxID=2499145 RepID=UPI001F495742|nr:acyl carrier protein [Rhodococcus sp. X156]